MTVGLLRFAARVAPAALGVLIVSGAMAQAPTATTKDEIIKALDTAPTATERGFVQVPIGGTKPAAPTVPATPATTAPNAAETTQAAPVHASVGVPILFDVNSATIKPESWDLLRTIVEALQSPTLSAAKIEVEGHTDARGSAELNLALSRERANAVRDFLIRDGNIPADRLSAVGKGMTEPADPSDPLSAVNRRVVLVNLSK